MERLHAKTNTNYKELPELDDITGKDLKLNYQEL